MKYMKCSIIPHLLKISLLLAQHNFVLVYQASRGHMCPHTEISALNISGKYKLAKNHHFSGREGILPCQHGIGMTVAHSGTETIKES